MLAGCVLGGVCLVDPKLGPPGGPSFGSVFHVKESKCQSFLIAASAAVPFWGPPGGPQNGSVIIK